LRPGERGKKKKKLKSNAANFTESTIKALARGGVNHGFRGQGKKD